VLPSEAVFAGKSRVQASYGLVTSVRDVREYSCTLAIVENIGEKPTNKTEAQKKG